MPNRTNAESSSTPIQALLDEWACLLNFRWSSGELWYLRLDESEKLESTALAVPVSFERRTLGLMVKLSVQGDG